MNLFLRKSGPIVLLIVLGAYALFSIRGPNGVHALTEKRKLIRGYQEQNSSLAADNQRRRERIERLKHNRSEQELEIRDRLKMVKPGETQFILPETPKEPAK
jgi:cell division protein FtsB